MTLTLLLWMAATQFLISHHGLVNAPVPPTWVPVRRPASITGRRSEIAQSVGWEIREENGAWRVRTSEAYHQQVPQLLTARLIGRGQFSLLSSLPLQADELTAGNQPMVSEALARVQQQDAVVAEIAEFQLTFLQTPTSQLSAALETLFVKLTARLPASELMVVDLAPELSARYTLAKLLLTADIAPDQLNQATLPTGQALATGGIFGAHLFIAPALLALAPYAFGVESARMRAAGVWLFGAAVAGLTWPSNQIIDAVRPLESRFTGPRQRAGSPPTLSADQLKAFFSWWVSQVNKVLSIATDPVNFVDTLTGEYDPAANWQYLASIERLFRDVAESLAATEGNETAQFRAAYDALDTLHGMRHRDFDDAVTPSVASKTLLRLQQDLAPDIAAVALPTCSRAVEALDQVKDGFTPTSSYYSASGLVGLPAKKGKPPMNVTWDAATSLYLRRDRNSAHSFLNMEDWEKALLFSHNGSLPRGVAGLAFLYLLDLVAHPEQLQAKSSRGLAAAPEAGKMGRGARPEDVVVAWRDGARSQVGRRGRRRNPVLLP